MQTDGGPAPTQPTPITEQERARLLRLCLRATGDRQAAEDLTQEALIEAWRHGHTLRDPLARDRWLAGIARNVCQRWMRARGRDQSRHVATEGQREGQAGTTRTLDQLPDNGDIALELERDDLAALLDRALALLPPATREVLIARYIQESPHAEIASRLGVSEKAVSMRLTRGRLLLRRILTTRFRPEAAAYGLTSTSDNGWHATRIWCPLCGQQHLLGRFDKSPATGSFALVCPHCRPRWLPGAISATAFADVPALGVELASVNGYKPAFTRLLTWSAAYYRSGLARRVAPCPKCGQSATVSIGAPAHWQPTLHTAHMIHLRCDRCRITPNMALAGLALALPEAQQFWREERRIRILPGRAITLAGQPALLTTLESVAGRGRLDIVSAPDDYSVLHVEPGDGR